MIDVTQYAIGNERSLRAMYYGPLPAPEILLATAARSLGRALPSSAFTSTDEH